MKKNLFKTVIALAIGTLAMISTSCGNKNTANEGKKTELSFGFAPGPYADLFKSAIQPSLEAKGYKVKIVELTDWVTPDLSLGNGEIDANIFQHSRYLRKISADKGLELSPVISIPTASLGLFSNSIKVSDIEALKGQLKEGNTVSLPNDPTNLARALIFLKDLGLITIKSNIDEKQATENDLDQNPFKLKIVPADAAQLPRSLDGTILAVIPGNYAISAGLNLANAIAVEHLVPETEIIVAVRTADLNAEWVADVKSIIESEKFKNFIENAENGYTGFQRPSWYLQKWGIQNK
ncbi:MAG TPA: MetQ/NlpA family ABC transporter substrate-binding protein [Paludibacteraceae bacterium]|nr:MetQ/NlpA family ABC transporter substrate-binding protein [Paludibacteraceae bacterium]HQF51132.1 MetQ/NlpA family ABC transporter substrate-binding protein [Paludibacteraceae bacterium]